MLTVLFRDPLENLTNFLAAEGMVKRMLMAFTPYFTPGKSKSLLGNEKYF
jgi:hypothetical protein